MSETEEVSAPVPIEAPPSPSERSVTSKEPSSPPKEETSRDGSTRTENEDMDETTSAITGNSSPVSHTATEPTSDMPEEDFEMDTSTDKVLVDSNVRRRPKGAGFYRQLDEGMDIMGDERSRSPGAGSTSSSSRKRRPRVGGTNLSPATLGKAADIQPEWLIPFDHGWKRQVIIRATSNIKNTPTSTNKAADTYYLPPIGKKLRSMPEIEKYLMDYESHQLSTANFTFRKEAIYKEPFETVRQAAKGSSFLKKATKKEEEKKEKVVIPPAPEVVSVTNSVLTVHKSSDRQDGPGKTVIRAVAKKHTGKRSNNTVFEGESASKKPRLENGNSVNGKQKLCSLDCPNRGGGPPSLHCEVCMCLYHPECVGYDRMVSRDAFICKTCLASENTLMAEKAAKKPTTTPTMPTMKRAPQISTSVQRSTPPIVRLMNPRPSSSIVAPSTPTTTPIAVNKPAPVRIPASFDPNNISGQLITLPPSLTTKLNLTKSVNLKWNGQSYVIPPNCFISTPDGLKVLLPSGTLSGANANKGTISAQVASGSVNLVNTSSLAQNTLSRPPRTLGNLSSVLPTSGATTPVTITPKVIAPTTSSSTSPNSPNIPTSVFAISPEPAATSSDKEPRPATVKIKSVPQCHFMKVQAGYDAMVHLFSFLSPADLLRASQVCRSWNHAVQSPSLWRRVQLRGYVILSWKKLVRCLQLRNTQVLDMRGMSMGAIEDRMEMWQEFMGYVRGLADTLRDLRLPHCPGNVLQAITESLPELEVLQAQTIIDPNAALDEIRSTDSRVAVAKFGGLTNLRELKLRGICGIQLPAFSIGGGLSELGQLKNLKTLSLTTLREATELEFNFLSSLKELETLELGDCYLWTKQTYEQLGELAKLSSLRLESGGDTTEGLGPALEKLDQLSKLELIRFPVDEELSGSLEKLSSLRQFSIWPDTDTAAAKVNAATRSAVSKMPFLQKLEWGVAAPDNTLLFPAEGDEEENSEGTALGINELVDTLHSSLPTTIIRVFRVPPQQKRHGK